MAALNYRCPNDPELHPASDEPGQCGECFEPYDYLPPTVPAPDPAAETTVALIFREILLVVPPGGLRLGRDAEDCAAVPGLASLLQISRVHADLYWMEGRLMVRDLDSSNGTFVDGERVGEAPLGCGSVLRLGLDVEVPVVELDEYGFPKT